MRNVATSSLVVVAACFDPTFRDPTCGVSGACPPGWMCPGGAGTACVLMPPPDAGACPSSWQEVLHNGNFEAGHTVWVEGPAGETAICSMAELTLNTKDGTYASCFGLRNSREQILTQDVTLPADTTRVRFQGYRCIATSETATQALDVMTLRLTAVGDDTDVIADLGTWSNLDGGATCRWTWFDQIADATSSPAQATLRIASKLDDNHVTSFYHDVLSLQAFAPAPCP